MSKVLREERLIYVDNIEKNSNKFWHGTLYENDDLYVEWGRVGANGQSKTHSGAGEGKLDKLLKSKLKKGYTHQRTVSGTKGGDKAGAKPVGNLTQLAVDQIDTSCKETNDLVRYLSKVNIHNITSNANITYDAVTGVFSTPLGVITQDGLDEARVLLGKISGYVAKDTITSKPYLTLCGDYMRIIPTDIGMKKFSPRRDMGTLEHMRQQNDLLDSLATALDQVADARKKQDKKAKRSAPKVFDVSLHLVADKKVVGPLEKLYKSTLQGRHACAHLKIKKVYAVSITAMAEAFEADGRKVGKIMRLWHGTRAANLLSILKSGFYIPPSNAAHCTGRMFGNGVYFSDQSTKSLNYAYGYWGGAKDSSCFMFLNEVAMGKHYVPKSYSERLPKAGYDSTFAKANKSGVMNNEMIVYRTGQINPMYLIQFGN